MRVLDLFSGIGGFAIGLERAGMNTVAFCEQDKFCQAVLRKHWPEVPIYDDVRTLTADRLASDGISVNVICGGFPCQDISTAGKGAGLAGERSGLWWEFHRLIAEIKPEWVIVENVAALRSKGLDAVLGSLAAVGYDAEWHCIPASAVGAPHRRDRIWIVAYPNGSMETDGRQRQIATREGDSGRDDPRRSDSNVGQVALRGAGQGQENVAYPGRQSAQIPTAGQFAAVSFPQRHSWWETEPNVGRVADGVSARTHRLKALGNAVVPQIPEIIGKVIYEPTHPNPK